VKTATEQPDNGQILEKTTRTRVIPVDSSPESRSTPEFWQYLQSLDLKPGEWDRHIVYLYRTDPGDPSGRGTPGGKYIRVMQFPDGTVVPLADQEEVELGMARAWGGRVYRFIVKKAHQRITEGRVYIDAPPKPIIISGGEAAGGTGGATVSPMGSDVSQIAGKAIDTIAGQEREAVSLGLTMMNTAASVVKQFSNGNGNPSPQDDMQRAFMAAMIQRMTMDPMQQMMQFFAMMKELNAATGGGGTRDPLVTQILETGLKRVLDPPASGAPAVSAGAELVRTLPSVASHITEGIREWRTGVEAQRDTVIAARAPQGQPQPTIQARPQTLPPSTPAPPPNPNGAEAMGGPSTEFVESRIIQILQQPLSADEAADAVLMFLHTIDGPEQPAGQGSVAQLVKLGESGLVQLFQFRPKLKPATANMPRLLEFIRAFLKLYAEDQETEQQPPTPPPLAN
jgi:hypothetical protein